MCDPFCKHPAFLAKAILTSVVTAGKQLALREDGVKGVAIPGLSVHRPTDADGLLAFLQKGNANRTQHPTDANAESSRSHAVFQVRKRISNELQSSGQGANSRNPIAHSPVTDRFGNSQASLLLFQVYLKQRPRSSGLSADVKVAKLSMIDLAGSEKVRIGN